MRVLKILVGCVLVVVVLGVVALRIIGENSATVKPQLSPTSGPLRAGDEKPNWISTTADPADTVHYMAPRKVMDNPIDRIAFYLDEKRMPIWDYGPFHVFAAASTPVFHFVDDLEFLYDPKTRMLHFRSASRVGYSDLGTNRKRMEKIIEDLDL